MNIIRLWKHIKCSIGRHDWIDGAIRRGGVVRDGKKCLVCGLKIEWISPEGHKSVFKQSIEYRKAKGQWIDRL